MTSKLIKKYLDFILKHAKLSILISLVAMIGLSAGLSQFYSKNDV